MQFLKQSIEFFHSCHDSEANKTLIAHVLPKEKINGLERLFEWVTQHLPFANWHYFQEHLLSINLLCFSSHEFDQQHSFLDMIQNQSFLKNLPFSSLQNIPFYLKGFTSKPLLLQSVAFVIEEKKIIRQFQQNLLLFTQSLSLGPQPSKMAKCSITNSMLASSHRCSTSQTNKILQIQKKFEYLLNRYPDRIETHLFSELACFLSFCSPVFFELRTARHLGRLIVSQYSMRRNIKRCLLNQPEKRHLYFRFFHTELNSLFGKKSVLGIMVVLSLLDKYESFDEEHILLIIQRWIPQATLVQGSCYLYQNPQDEKICTVYLEVNKKEESFNLEELQCLRKILAIELKECVQKLMPVLFTIRNEEQILKNIITLNREIDSKESLPQLMIHFEKQTEMDLVFVVMIVYVNTNQQIENSLQNTHGINMILERKSSMGYLEGIYPKQALVYRSKLPKSKDLLRNDFSVNIDLARNKVYVAICQAIGEVRDYDGGLILKKQELFLELQQRFSKQLDTREEILENFFYSISPIERQAAISVIILEKLFTMVLASLNREYREKGSYCFNTEKYDSYLFIFIRAEDATLKNKISEHLRDPFKEKIISTFFSIRETIGIGFIIEASNQSICDQFLLSLKIAIQQWKEEREKKRTLRLNFDKQILTLDPRMLKDAVSKEVLQMLFEGLMRIGTEKKPEYAIAESVDISTCQKTYIFHLRECRWSNGSLVEAYSFEYSWKKILSPDFITPYVHFLFPIKNAHAAKNRKVPVSEIGVRALDARTLRVDLEYSLPYFLELLALPIFSPVNHLIDQIHPHWPSAEAETYLCNGPFLLKKNQPGETYIFEKNPFYWDVKNVYLNQIILSSTNARTALEMFKNGEIDWLGDPMRLWDPMFEYAKSENSEMIHLMNRVYWCTLNTKIYPLKNKKLRQALSLVLNRQQITQTFPNTIPTFSPLPPNHAQHFYSGEIKGELSLAIRLFEESLEELNLTRKTFPTLRFLYRDSKKIRTMTEEIRDQWKQAFNIEIQIQSYDFPLLFQKITQGDYEIAEMSWLSWINDPLYTLYAFYSEDDYLNFPKWESVEFQTVLEEARHTNNSDNRSRCLALAEAILIKEIPVIPIVVEKNQAIKKKSLKIELNHELADFKTAIFNS